MRHSRFIAYTLIVTLMASVIAGALGVTLHFAEAAVSSDELVLREVINSGREHLTGNNLTLFESIISTYIEPSFDNTNYLICVCCPTTTFDPDVWHMTIYRGYEGGNLWYMNSSGYFSNYKSGATYAYTDVWQVADVLCNANESYYSVGMPSGNGNWESYLNNLPKFSFNGSGGLAVPCGQTFTSSSCGVWINRDIRKLYDDYGVLHNANMILDVPMIEFDIKVFWLGERKYITTVNQQIAYQSDPDKMFYVFEIGDSIEDGHSRVLLSYNSSSNSRGITLLPGGEAFVSGLTNVSPQGVYAWDITDIDWDSISYFTLFEYPSTDVSGYAVNCPYYLNEAAPEPGSGGTPDSYTTMWQEFNSYVNNYNLTHVIPDDLSSWLFGISGSNIYPASVSVPLEVWNNNRSVNDPASFADIHTWKWWLNENNININFELMDVVIVSESSTGNYSLIYYYDDRLSTPWKPVENVSFDDLSELFDVIIIVPDNDNCLIGNSWWQNALSVILTVLGWDNTISLLNSLAVSGTSSLGVEYVDERPEENAHVLDAFCIVTKKCLDKQKMLVFSDYLPKLYKLMSEYVVSEDNWKTDFLRWSSSMFYGLNTIDGTLNKILSIIDGIRFDLNSKLDQLIQNTSEEEPNHWFPSLWLWVLQFKPSNNDFTVALDVYDDNWDNIPLLPAPSPVPALPTIQGG